MPEQLALTAYRFDELPQEVKARLLDKCRHWNVDYSDWAESVSEMFLNTLPNWYKVVPESSQYALYGQGDFASFETRIDLEAYAKDYPQYTRLGKLAQAGWLSAGTLPQRYGHAIHVDTDWGRRTPRVDRLVNALEADLREDYEARCRALLRDLYTEYEYLTSDGAIMEHLTDVLFLKNGTIVKCTDEEN